MSNLYIYGGYLCTGGKLDDGKPWQGFSVLLGSIRNPDEMPLKGKAVKARRTDEMLKFLQGLPIGCPVEAYFDEDGRLTLIRVYKSNEKGV